MVSSTAREKTNEFCVTVGPVTITGGKLIRLIKDDGRLRLYSGLIGFNNPCWLKHGKRGWAPSQWTIWSWIFVFSYAMALCPCVPLSVTGWYYTKINIIYTPLRTVQQIYYIHNVVQMQLISYIHGVPAWLILLFVCQANSLIHSFNVGRWRHSTHQKCYC